jgi:hypothetical protein
MKILVQREGRWASVERQAWATEELLERLIYESPEVIPADPGVAQVVYARQFPCPPGYSIDLVGVGSDGGISIVECKLDRNREAKRQVVGQILEYAAGLWGMALEEFEQRFINADATFSEAQGRSPFDALYSDSLVDAADIADLRARVAHNLETGRFRLLIAVDEISAQLQSIIRYVNAHSGGQLKLVALALPEFSDEVTRVLVPVTYGNESPSVSQVTQSEALSAEAQIEVAKDAWRPALAKMHAMLTETLVPEPRPRHVYYVDPSLTLRMVDMWPSEGRIYRGRADQGGFEVLMEEAGALGLNVGKDSIRFADASNEALEAFIQLVKQHMLRGPEAAR